METDAAADDAAFSGDEVSALVKEAVDSVLAGQAYSEKLVPRWTSEVLQAAVAALAALQKPYKYACTCAIMQKMGAGFHTAASAYWDRATDGSRTVKWENKTVYVIVTVFALAV